MKQEQKAKAYDEALEWMRKVYPTLTGADKEDAEHYFPELALSEDEKMINGLQGFLSAFGSDYFGTDGWQKFDDWLEKQKEQKPAENGGKELLYVSNKSYNIGYRDGKREAEQKTAEWNEEDEKMSEGFMHKLEVCDLLTNKEIAWAKHRLNSLRPQPIQVKESYKDGFQTARHVAASAFMEYCNKNRPNGKMCLSNGECEDIENAFSVGDWAKIERYIHKYHWKPSEEQMYSLGSVVNGAGEATEGSTAYHLKELYEQLKKL